MALRRPRLLVASLAVAVVVSAVGGWALSGVMAGDGVPDDVVLDEPGEYQQPVDPNPDRLGDLLPDVELVDAEGVAVPTASLVGTPIVVNLWYASCPPCARELADFAEVDAERDDVRFVGVNPIDDADAMVDFASDRDVRYDLLRDPDAELVDALGIVNCPATLFVGADGRIVLQEGVLDADELRFHLGHVFGT